MTAPSGMGSALGCVVVNYRTNDDLAEFLDSWVRFHPTHLECRLVIVDVEPLDQSVGTRVAIKYSNIEYLSLPVNVGYARACNFGAEGLRCGALAFFNADVVLTEGALQECWAALQNLPGCGVLGPRQVDERGRLTAAGIVGTQEAPQHRGWLEHDTGQYRDVVSVPTVAGSAIFVDRRVWLELTECPLFQHAAPGAIGAFLPTPHYYEETFLCYHARNHGYDVMYYGSVTVVHKWHKASPVGGWAEQQMPVARALFREACRIHAIPCD